MTYVPHNPEEIRQMLERIGVKGIEDLFQDIPADRRFPDLQYPAGLTTALSEPEALRHLGKLARLNHTPADGPWFLGGGMYHHYIPAVVGAITSRGEFLSSYTPYQPEVSQGTLQALFEYQSMMAELTGMAAVNASHYDGATALAEAVLMALKLKPGRVLVPTGLNPLYREVLDSYLVGTVATTVDYPASPCSAELGGSDASPLSAVVVQWPDFLGQLWELEGLAETVHAQGALLIIHVDPIMLGLLCSPGSLGADIVTAEGQALGIPMSFGGPALGIIACTQALVRRIPGRLVGQAFDHQGRRGFTLTLSAREQHIRREKAVSNICSNQGLMALSACVYLASMGPVGLAEIGQLCRERAWEAAQGIAALPGFSVPALDSSSGMCPHFFKEFLVRCPVPAAEMVQAIRNNYRIEAGLPLIRLVDSAKRSGASHELLVCATELTSHEDIQCLLTALANPHRRPA